MIDNTKVNHYEEQIYQAIDAITAKRLENVKFDQTILCTITDNTYKKDGKYTVKSADGLSFEAYSDKTNYNKNAQVYVTIPQGNYSNQKFIAGYATGKDAIKPYTYISPFERLFDMTENLLPENSGGALKANGDEKLFKIYDSSEDDNFGSKDLIGFSTLGIRANFESYISDVVQGNYSLSIEIKAEQSETPYVFTLGIEDFFGNPYNFSNPTEQQTIVDISFIESKITSIIVNFVQVQGSFKNSEGEDYPEARDENLKVSNVYLCMGKLVSEFDGDFVEIYTLNGLEFGNTKGIEKTLKLRWIHEDKDGNQKVIIQDNINSLGDNCEIRWYHYKVGAAADDYSSVYWEAIKKDKDGNTIGSKDFSIGVSLNKAQQTEKFKAIVLLNNVPYRSDILQFNNENEVAINVEVTKFINPLTIVTEDGTNGNYFLYGQNKQILEQNLSKKVRKLQCYFDTDPTDKKKGGLLQGEHLKKVTWFFPIKNTMIKLKDPPTGEIKDTDDFYKLTNKVPEYTIASSWDINANNNTIICQYEDEQGLSYSTTKEFTFGTAGTMGTEQTLVIDFADNINAVNINQKSTIKFKVQCYNLSGEAQAVSSAKWKWKGGNTLSSTTDSNGNTAPGDELWLDSSSIATSMGTLRILECSVGPLTTYFPVPLCSSDNYSYIEGPTQIIYQSDGVPYYHNVEYKLYDNNGSKVNSVKWEVIGGDVTKGSLKEEKGIYYLNPYPMYIDNADVYGVQCLINDTNVVWTQPILTLMNRWPSGTINKWDGQSLEIDKEKGIILSPSIAAGRVRDGDDAFSGVMLGDWSQKNDENEVISTNTGIYGFNNGEMSYAFKDDGTAFIGKSGLGRIKFDGKEGVIESANFSSNNQGVQLDLTDGTLILKGESGGNLVYLSSSPSEGKKPFEIGENFTVDWDGTIVATNGTFSGKIIATSGKIGDGFRVEQQESEGDKGNTEYEYITYLTGKVFMDDKTQNGRITFLPPEANAEVYLSSGIWEKDGNIPTKYGLQIRSITKEGLLGAGARFSLSDVVIYGNENGVTAGSRFVCDFEHVGISIGNTPDQNNVMDQAYVVCYPNKVEINAVSATDATLQSWVEFTGNTIDFHNSNITGMKILFG